MTTTHTPISPTAPLTVPDISEQAGVRLDRLRQLIRKSDEAKALFAFCRASSRAAARPTATTEGDPRHLGCARRHLADARLGQAGVLPRDPGRGWGRGNSPLLRLSLFASW